MIYTKPIFDLSIKLINAPCGPYANEFSEKQHKYGPCGPIANLKKNKMRKLTWVYVCCLLVCTGFSFNSSAQQVTGQFTGAKANLKHYKALYVLNSGEDKKITGTLRNIKNALEDPRLKGKLEVELIVFGDGVAVYSKENAYEKTLLDLKGKGVILAQCENTIKERKIAKEELFDFISYVPSGNGEIIIRHYDGWAIVHP